MYVNGLRFAQKIGGRLVSEHEWKELRSSDNAQVGGVWDQIVKGNVRNVFVPVVRDLGREGQWAQRFCSSVVRDLGRMTSDNNWVGQVRDQIVKGNVRNVFVVRWCGIWVGKANVRNVFLPVVRDLG